MTKLEAQMVRAQNKCAKILDPKTNGGSYKQSEFDFYMNKLKELSKIKKLATEEISDEEAHKIINS